MGLQVTEYGVPNPFKGGAGFPRQQPTKKLQVIHKSIRRCRGRMRIYISHRNIDRIFRIKKKKNQRQGVHI